jgi:hypothetical protein
MFIYGDQKEIKMKKQTVLTVILLVFSFLLITMGPCQANQKSWGCANDDEVNDIYRVCNYFPLDPTNQWLYTTGDYFISDDTRKCSSGYSGILYATTLYEYSSYVQNGSRGFLGAGCQYDEGVFEDMGTRITIFPPQMEVGQTVTSSFTKFGQKSTVAVTLVGLEAITVTAGTFTTLKIEIMINDIGKCSYKTTIWLAKGIGPIKIHRTDANPADCGGCIFVCNPDGDRIKLNTPAELVSYYVDSSQGPDLTGTWTSLIQTCKDSKNGIRCKVKGKLNIQNIGTKNAASSIVKFYLSDDNTFDAADTYLKQVSIKNIITGESLDKNFKYAFPYGQTLTDKYIITVIDVDNTVVEAIEDNNIISYGPMQ